MTIERGLRTHLARAFGERSWDENPLVTIGLSHAILSLRVTDRQLYRIVRSYMRQLAAAVHPDTATVDTPVDTPEITAERARIMVAFDLLDDEKTFLKALNEFRSLKSDERREIVTLRASLRSAQERVRQAGVEMSKLGEGRRELREERGVFERKKVEEAPLVPGLQSQLAIATKARDRWYTLFTQRNKLNHNLVSFIRWCQAYLSVQSLRFEGEKLEGTVVRPLVTGEAKELFVLSFRLYRSRKKSPGVSSSEPPRFIRERYLEQLECLRKMAQEKFRGNAVVECTFQRLLVKNGCLGGKSGERLAGSLRFDDVATATYKRIGRPPNIFVLRHLVPFLLPGSFLVSLPRKKTMPLSEYGDVYDLMATDTRDNSVFRSDRIILDVK